VTGPYELKSIPGIEIVGPLPPEVQKYKVFSAGIVAGSRTRRAP
jgi:molybdate transport system substrate-binding protein